MTAPAYLSSDTPVDTAAVTDVDVALGPLLPAVEEALVRRGLVVVLSRWQYVPEAPLLPFHLQLRWPDRLDCLPLHWCAALVPCTNADRRVLERQIYKVNDSYTARRDARAWRRLAQIDHPRDYELEGWELGFRRHSDMLSGRVLAGSSYVAVGTVGRSGKSTTASRPVLGRFSGRGSSHPGVLIPGRGMLEREALDVLAAADLCVCSIQGLRGKRTIDMVRSVLERRTMAPTLIVAHSPSDLFALHLPDIVEVSPLHMVGPALRLRDVRATCLCVDRIQEEQKFYNAISGLRGLAPSMDMALDTVEAAWWVARQNVAPEMAMQTVWPRVLAAVDRVRVSAPAEVGLLTSALTLVERTIKDAGRARERLDALLKCADEHFSHPTEWRTVCVVRDGSEAGVVRSALEAHYGAPYTELRALGLQVRSARGADIACDSIIVNGCQGMQTIDVALASGAHDATFLLDPIEARVVHAHALRMGRFLARTLDRSMLHVLNRIAGACAPIMATDAGIIRVSLDTLSADTALPDDMGLMQRTGETENGPQAHITFIDGTSITCLASQELDVLQDSGVTRFRPVPASDLVPGDEVVLIVSEHQARFSEHMLRCLDEGVLHGLVEQRRQWLSIAAALRGKRTAAGIHRGLQKRGVTVDYQTVRGWLRLPDEGDDGSVPRSWAVFQELAAELQYALPDVILRGYFDAIRRLRVEHRKKGRALVRIIRATATHRRLDIETLYKIEQEWGMTVRDLVEGARLCIVDDVCIM